MKTVSGKVTSTTPISLSDAAKSLSEFASSNHEASHAVSLYLQRAADAFNHLVKVHQKLSSLKEHSTDDIKVDEISESKNLGNEDVVKNDDIPDVSRENKNLGKEENTEVDTRSKIKNSAKIDKVKDQKLIKSEKRVDIGEGEMEKSKKNELEFVKIDKVKGQKLIKTEQQLDIGEGETVKSNTNELNEVKEDGMKGKDKKKRKKKNKDVGDSEHEVGKVEEDLGNTVEEEGKKRKSMDPDAGENAGSAERTRKKKSKKRRIEGEK